MKSNNRCSASDDVRKRAAIQLRELVVVCHRGKKGSFALQQYGKLMHMQI